MSDGPASQIDRCISRVVQLDEIVGVRRATIAATAVDLVDDDIGAVRGCGCSRCDDGHGACCQRDCERGTEALAGSGHGNLSGNSRKTVDSKNKLTALLRLRSVR